MEHEQDAREELIRRLRGTYGGAIKRCPPGNRRVCINDAGEFYKNPPIRRVRKATRKKPSLKKASLKRASLKRASLKKASLKRASLKKASLKRASLKKSCNPPKKRATRKKKTYKEKYYSLLKRIRTKGAGLYNDDDEDYEGGELYDGYDQYDNIGGELIDNNEYY